METLVLEVADAGMIMFYQTPANNFTTDSGYDLYMPTTMILPANATTMVDLMVVSFLWIPINAPMRMMTAKTDETI